MEPAELRPNLVVYHRLLDRCGLVASWNGEDPDVLHVHVLNQHGHMVDPQAEEWRLADLDVLTPA